MRTVRAIIVTLLFVPIIALSAAQDPAEDNGDASDFRVINPQVNAWAGGTVTKVGDNQIEISGAQLPFLTARAQMHQEMRQKLAGIDDPQQRLQMAKQIKEAWEPKLDAAANQKLDATSALTFNAPANCKDLVILDSKSIRELPFFQNLEKLHQVRVKMGRDMGDLAALYEKRQERLEARAERRDERPVSVSVDQDKAKAAAEKMSENAKERVEAVREKLSTERLSPDDLKAGDKVLIGYNSDGNTAFTIVRGSGD